MEIKHRTYLVSYSERNKINSCKITARDIGGVVDYIRHYHPGASVLLVELCTIDTNKKEEKKVDLTKKITVELTEDDIKEIVAEYVARELCRKIPKKDDIEFVCGVKYSGPQMDRVEHRYLKECKVKC